MQMTVIGKPLSSTSQAQFIIYPPASRLPPPASHLPPR